ncbi:MAG: DUF4321 domain-containing protein [candidate division Zixibacteria bacterium]|nr:DUF4321 domain-containing protein [candidate division Zixibacteria bacterium]MCH8027797.1 DUF4321 domain-containing protein [candidate division Zixibacteria bacterium]
MKRREVLFITVALILGAVIGGLLGEIIATYLPDGAAKTLFSKSIEIGFQTLKVDFYAISFTVGLMLKINLLSALAVILVMIYFRWWYL